MRRNWRDILAEMLDYCLTPRRQTHIIYNTNISKTIWDYVSDIALKAGLLFYDKEHYETTQKGILYLAKWHDITVLTAPVMKESE